MGDIFNIYCDESCHLERDVSNVMILGAMSCAADRKDTINKEIRELKVKHGISSWAETKWVKVSASKVDFYLALIDYFFSNDNLTFRGLVATKSNLNHDLYNQGSYDLWFYKMYYLLLNYMIMPSDEYRIFIDVKAKFGGSRISQLKKVLCNNMYDFKQEVIRDLCQIQSHESEIMQLADLFSGALSFAHRGFHLNCNSSVGKRMLIDRLMRIKKVDLTKSTPKNEQKFNIFVWQSRGAQ